MFSKMMAGLRAEAEKVSGANFAMLADSRQTRWQLKDKFSGHSVKNGAAVSGAALSMGGMLSLIGVAMANQAAGSVAMYAGATAAQTAAWGAVGLSTSAGAFTTMLAGASATLAGLGTVAIGSAILPVATVIAMGAGVAGIAVIGISQLMKTDIDKGNAIADAVINKDRGSLDKIGRQNVGVSDWLMGAKNFVSSGLRDIFSKPKNMTLEGEPVVENSKDAAELYEIEDLFSRTNEESIAGRGKMVEKIGSDIWDKHGVVVTDEKLHECLGATRGDSTAYGKILAVDLKSGLVIQSSGRGQATVHNLKDFQKAPVVNQDATISYKGGKMQGALEQGAEDVKLLDRKNVAESKDLGLNESGYKFSSYLKEKINNSQSQSQLQTQRQRN